MHMFTHTHIYTSTAAQFCALSFYIRSFLTLEPKTAKKKFFSMGEQEICAKHVLSKVENNKKCTQLILRFDFQIDNRIDTLTQFDITQSVCTRGEREKLKK